MKIVLIILGTLVAIVIIVVAVGFALPVKHRAVGEARYSQSPSEIFTVITEPKGFPLWRPSVKRVEILPDSTGAKTIPRGGIGWLDSIRG